MPDFHDDQLDRLGAAIGGIRAEVTGHRIHGELRDRAGVAVFMAYHVFAVWDYMSLLKALQGRLTCVRVPWIPRGDPAGRRLLNELVLVEESGGDHGSQFELYRQAMAVAGADTVPIDEFLGLLRSGIPVTRALVTAGVPDAAAEFVRTTWSLVSEGSVHQQAAAFAFGREDLIPAMFGRIEVEDERLALFRLYLGRHLEADRVRHAPMARRLLADLCGDDESRWRECLDTVHEVLRARLALWDGISAALPRPRIGAVRPG